MKPRFRASLTLILAALLIAPAFDAEGRSKRRSKQKKSRSHQSQYQGMLVGGGMQDVFPPMLTVHGVWRSSAFEAGAELGYMVIPLSEFSGSSTYMGLDGRYFLTSGWAVGAGLGRRTFEIATTSDFHHDAGTTEILWTRNVDQLVMTPHVAWEPRGKSGLQYLVTLGLVIPLSSSLTSERDVQSINGVPDSVLDDEEEVKADDVRKITDAILPLLGVKVLFPVGG